MQGILKHYPKPKTILNILGESQNGFRKGRCNVDLFILKTLFKKAGLEKKKMFVVFADITIAYDRVSHDALWVKLQKLGFSDRFIGIIQAMYRVPKAVISWENVKTRPLDMSMGLRQGCILSPILFAFF